MMSELDDAAAVADVDRAVIDGVLARAYFHVVASETMGSLGLLESWFTVRFVFLMR